MQVIFFFFVIGLSIVSAAGRHTCSRSATATPCSLVRTSPTVRRFAELRLSVGGSYLRRESRHQQWLGLWIRVWRGHAVARHHFPILALRTLWDLLPARQLHVHLVVVVPLLGCSRV